MLLGKTPHLSATGSAGGCGYHRPSAAAAEAIRKTGNTYEDAANIGLKLTSFDLDRNRHADGAFTLSAAEVAQNILNEHGEGCATYKTAEAFLNDHNPVFAAYMDEENELFESYEAEEKLSDIEQDFLVSLLEDYSIILQNEYEYLISRKAVIETIEANEYDFTEDGILL